MSSTPPRATSSRTGFRRLLVVALITIGLVVPAIGAPAGATDWPPVDATVLREVPQRTSWGVTGWDRTAAHNFENYVWDFAQIGNRMYVAGSFLNVQNGRTGAPQSQPYLAAFNVDTGAWIPQFAPRLDGAVFALEVNSNGSLLAGGQFRNVNGSANNSGIVALNPTTGATDARFGGYLRRPGSTDPAIVRALEVIGNQVYVGGNFSRILWAGGGQRLDVGKLARMNANTGVPDATWLPNIGGGAVYGFGIDQGRGRMHLGGISINAINGTPVTRFGTIDLTRGALVGGQAAYRFNDNRALDIWDVTFAGDKVFTGGTEHILQILAGGDRRLLGYHTTGMTTNTFEFRGFFAGGDIQVTEKIGNWVLAGCHCTYEVRNGRVSWYDSVANIRRPIRMAGLVNASTMRVDDWSPDLAGSREGVWAAGSDDRGCLWLGGQFDVAGLEAGATFWVGNFGRFCPPGVGGAGVDRVSPTAPADLTLSQVGRDVQLRWGAATDNVGVAGYIVIRDGVEIATTTSLNFTDPAPSLGWHTYRIKAFDAAGNRSGNSNVRSINVG